MNNWLQEFAYRIEISWWVFVVAGVSAILIALLAVSFSDTKSSHCKSGEEFTNKVNLTTEDTEVSTEDTGFFFFTLTDAVVGLRPTTVERNKYIQSAFFNRSYFFKTFRDWYRDKYLRSAVVGHKDQQRRLRRRIRFFFILCPLPRRWRASVYSVVNIPLFQDHALSGISFDW